MRPADGCCGCSLPQAVQFLSTYCMVRGFVNIMVFFLGVPESEVKPPAPMLMMQAVDEVVGVFALFAGLVGFQGATLRDAKRVYLVAGYFFLLVLCAVATGVVDGLYICEELDDLHKAGKHTDLTCDTVQSSIIMRSIMQGFTNLFFSYICWSLYRKIEDGEILSPFEDPLGPFGGGMPMMGAMGGMGGPFGGPFMHPSSLQPDQVQPLAGPPRPQAPQVQPFQGQSHTLQEQAFTGPAYRLD